MFENHKMPLISRVQFLNRLLKNCLAAIVIIVASLTIGMCGFHYIEALSWIDCYLESSLILSGMGPTIAVHTTTGKIFAGTFALYSGFTILLTVGIVIAPIVHRFLHKFHIDMDEKTKRK